MEHTAHAGLYRLSEANKTKLLQYAYLARQSSRRCWRRERDGDGNVDDGHSLSKVVLLLLEEKVGKEQREAKRADGQEKARVKEEEGADVKIHMTNQRERANVHQNTTAQTCLRAATPLIIMGLCGRRTPASS